MVSELKAYKWFKSEMIHRGASTQSLLTNRLPFLCASPRLANVPGANLVSNGLIPSPGYSPTSSGQADEPTIAGGFNSSLPCPPINIKPFSGNISTYGSLPEMFLGSTPTNGIPMNTQPLPIRHNPLVFMGMKRSVITFLLTTIIPHSEIIVIAELKAA